jgi:hypothetical protein
VRNEKKTVRIRGNGRRRKTTGKENTTATVDTAYAISKKIIGKRIESSELERRAVMEHYEREHTKMEHA